MFSVSSWKRKFTTKKNLQGKALLGLLGLALNSEKPVPIGYFRGMELQIQHLPFGNEYHARLVGFGTYSTQLGADVRHLTRLSNLANGIEPSIEKDPQYANPVGTAAPAPRKKSSGHFHRQRN